MKLLALDSATEACSAALYLDGELVERYRVEPRGHAQLLLPMIDELLAEAGIGPTQLDAVAFGRGPGSFTGLRIAAGITQGIAFGADIPVVPVSSLAAIAQSAVAEVAEDNLDGLLVAIDARMQEVYWGGFVLAGDTVRCAIAESVCPPGAVALPESGRWLGLGTGWSAYAEELNRVAGSVLAGIDGERLPHARDIAILAVQEFQAGRVVAAEQALPVYIRDQVTHQNN